MREKKRIGLTDAERRIMNILWDRGGATAGDVHKILSQNRPVAYTTAQKILQILRRKQIVDGEMLGRAVYYTPAVAREAARRDAVRSLAEGLFRGSDEALAMHLIENQDLTDEALTRLEKKIEEALTSRDKNPGDGRK